MNDIKIIIVDDTTKDIKDISYEYRERNIVLYARYLY